MTLHGRETEQATIAGLLASARSGVGASLALVGEPGAGKSSLLRDTARQAAQGMTVVTTSGIESEAPLAFAALQRLLRPLMQSIRDRRPRGPGCYDASTEGPAGWTGATAEILSEVWRCVS